MAAANKLIMSGVNAYKEQQYETALEFFTQAISLTPSNAKLYDSRSATLEKLGMFKEALKDAKMVCVLTSEDEVQKGGREADADGDGSSGPNVKKGMYQGFLRSARLFMKLSRPDKAHPLFLETLDRIQQDDNGNGEKKDGLIKKIELEAKIAKEKILEWEKSTTSFISGLPLDIFVEILLHIVYDTSPTPSYSRNSTTKTTNSSPSFFSHSSSPPSSPLIPLTQVSHSWRNVCFSNPILWTVLMIDLEKDFKSVVVSSSTSKGKGKGKKEVIDGNERLERRMKFWEERLRRGMKGRRKRVINDEDGEINPTSSTLTSFPDDLDDKNDTIGIHHLHLIGSSLASPRSFSNQPGTSPQLISQILLFLSINYSNLFRNLKSFEIRAGVDLISGSGGGDYGMGILGRTNGNLNGNGNGMGVGKFQELIWGSMDLIGLGNNNGSDEGLTKSIIPSSTTTTIISSHLRSLRLSFHSLNQSTLIGLRNLTLTEILMSFPKLKEFDLGDWEGYESFEKGIKVGVMSGMRIMEETAGLRRRGKKRKRRNDQDDDDAAVFDSNPNKDDDDDDDDSLSSSYSNHSSLSHLSLSPSLPLSRLSSTFSSNHHHPNNNNNNNSSQPLKFLTNLPSNYPLSRLSNLKTLHLLEILLLGDSKVGVLGGTGVWKNDKPSQAWLVEMGSKKLEEISVIGIGARIGERRSDRGRGGFGKNDYDSPWKELVEDLRTIENLNLSNLGRGSTTTGITTLPGGGGGTTTTSKKEASVAQDSSHQAHYPNFTPSSLKPSLQKFTCIRTTSFPQYALNAWSIPRLKSLTLIDVKNIISVELFDRLSIECGGIIEKIDLRGSSRILPDFNSDPISLTPSPLPINFSKFKKLKDLNVSRCEDWVEGKFIESLKDGCFELERLELSECGGVRGGEVVDLVLARWVDGDGDGADGDDDGDHGGGGMEVDGENVGRSGIKGKAREECSSLSTTTSTTPQKNRKGKGKKGGYSGLRYLDLEFCTGIQSEVAGWLRCKEFSEGGLVVKYRYQDLSNKNKNNRGREQGRKVFY